MIMWKLSLLIVGALWTVSCSDTKQIYIQTDPTRSEVYVNERYAGVTPLMVDIPKHERSNIYVYRTGYLPVYKELEPKMDAEGLFLLSGAQSSGRNIQEKELLIKLKPATIPQSNQEKKRSQSGLVPARESLSPRYI